MNRIIRRNIVVAFCAGLIFGTADSRSLKGENPTTDRWTSNLSADDVQPADALTCENDPQAGSRRQFEGKYRPILDDLARNHGYRLGSGQTVRRIVPPLPQSRAGLEPRHLHNGIMVDSARR